MAYIPPDAKWYVADVVIEIRVDGDPHNVVQINTPLVRADSPEQAYDEAMALGRREEAEYLNPDGRTVRITFRGLEDLNVIHDPLEHGAELFYSERVGLSEPEIQHRLTPKEQLPIFQPRTPKHVPNYMPKDIADQLRSAGFNEPYDD